MNCNWNNIVFGLDSFFVGLFFVGWRTKDTRRLIIFQVSFPLPFVSVVSLSIYQFCVCNRALVVFSVYLKCNDILYLFYVLFGDWNSFAGKYVKSKMFQHLNHIHKVWEKNSMKWIGGQIQTIQTHTVMSFVFISWCQNYLLKQWQIFSLV